MKTINYKQSLKTSVIVMVNDAVAEFLEQEAQEEKRAKWRDQKRKNVSLERLESKNIQIACPNSNPLDILIMREETKDFTWNLPLPEKNKKIIILRFRYGITIRQIAENMGLSKSTVSDYIQKSLNILRGGGQNMVTHSLYSDGSFDSFTRITEE